MKSVNLELEQQREMDGEIEREDDRAAGCRDTDWVQTEMSDESEAFWEDAPV